MPLPQPDPASRSVATADGILFAVCAQCDAYLSTNRHRRGGNPDVNCWAETCPPASEYAIFYVAFVERWMCEGGTLWGAATDFRSIGANGERMAKFPARQNAHDPWHGYPISTLDKHRRNQHTPPRNVLEAWIAAGVLNEFDASRVRRGRI